MFKNESIVTVNYPTSINNMGAVNHTRINSNHYGQSIISNLNIGSGRIGAMSNRELHSN